MLVHSTCIPIRASRSIWIVGGKLEDSVLEGFQDFMGLMVQVEMEAAQQEQILLQKEKRPISEKLIWMVLLLQ